MDEYKEVEQPTFDLAPSVIESSVEHIPDVAPAIAVMSSRDSIYGDEVKHAAQVLHTQVYLQKDFISESDIDAQGIFTDKYSSRSTYLLAESEYRQSACRYIHANKKDGILSLPTAEHFSLDPDTIIQVAGVNRLSDLKHHEVIEVSGLASVQHESARSNGGNRAELDATRLLYASIIRDSLDNGHKLWLLNIDEKHLRALKVLIGREQVHQLGEPREYMGPATVPVAINPQEVVRAAFTDESDYGAMKRQYLLESLPGVHGKHIPNDIKEMLTEHNIPYDEDSRLRRVATHPRTIAYAAILGYSSARAVPVSGVEEFQGSVPLLWAIDVGTAVPYTWGLITTASAKTPIRRAVGATVAGGSFVAPYAYFWSEGQDYPPYVNAVVGGLIGTAALLEIAKNRKEQNIVRRLITPDIEQRK